jgi:hypothetical protein
MIYETKEYNQTIQGHTHTSVNQEIKIKGNNQTKLEKIRT